MHAELDQKPQVTSNKKPQALPAVFSNFAHSMLSYHLQ
ncbi:hypothetical protein D020_3125 [Vibrio parahaemolyticus SBR10290]|nr:hypothetical protein D052_3595 [Vibrio parahaemolyticus 10290]EQL91670.1 hypothetical protein D019_3476 [Vibrio parahaemolyticus VP2007-095]ESV68554.1 hypothetical protein D021_2284 [Vibrio parahaemolyticus 10296]ESW44270.1 hypothetical protein D022_2232 [Vibrio parahaemolyticus 12310]ETT20696.1 hypothetical protein D023_2395 [Vibrio parahaemolyticus 3256]ETX53184.1 hypothetical protein D020_3125 [Vibrio parahaemolyticus SBR10290]